MMPYNPFDDIVLPDYTRKIQSEEFNSLSLEEQNIFLKNTIISLSCDFEKFARIMIGLQDNIKDLAEWADRDLMYTNRRIDNIDDTVKEHVNSVHSYLIIGKEKEDK